MDPLRHPGLLAFAAFLLAGCAAKPPTADPSVAEPKSTKLLDIGGQGQDTTATFVASGGRLRIDYRLSRPPQRPQMDVAALRNSGGEQFDPVSTVSQPTAGKLSGSLTLSLIPGRYRLRVETDVPWTATVYESSR